MYKRLIDMYHTLREAGSVSDFPYLLGNTMYKSLMKNFEAVSSEWRKIVRIGNLNDFKSHDRVILHGAPNLNKIVKAGRRVGGYDDWQMKEDKYSIQLDTEGLQFTIGREVIINDDLDGLKAVPLFMGNAAGRTLNEGIVDLIEGDHLCYHGKTLFHADHSNRGSTTLANTVAGKAAVQAAINAIEKATDSSTGKKIGLKAKYIVTGIDLQFVVAELLKSVKFENVSTTGGSEFNSLAGRLTQVVLPDISSATSWYVMADPVVYPTIEVGFLHGKQTPDMLMKKAEMVNLVGGDDPYGYEFDDITYKIRYDNGMKLGAYQGMYRGKA